MLIDTTDYRFLYNEEKIMKLNMITKAVSAVILATVATQSMATFNTTGAVVQHPVNLLEYQKADSSYEDAYLNGTLNVRDSDTADTSYDAQLGINYEKVDSSRNSNFKYGAEARGYVKKEGNADRQEKYNGNAHIVYDRYLNPNANDLFVYGQGALAVEQEHDNGDAGLKNPLISATAGVGYGRVNDLTPMARSMRLIEALIQNGNLSATPAPAVYNTIAEIIEREDAYRAKYGEKTYQQYWIGDVQKALGVNLGASGAIRAYDVLTKERISTRKYGWEVRAGAGATLKDYAGNSGDPTFELQGNYYYPVNNKTQFSNEAKVTGVLNDNSKNYNLNNAMSLTYELTDTIDWENKWDLNYQNRENANNLTTNRLSSTFAYDLGNNLNYEATASLTHAKVEGQDASVDKGLYMGVKYRLK